MEWLIIRTEYHREKAVAAQIDKKGFMSWVPMQKHTKRQPGARRHMDRSNVLETIERPVCPSLLFAAVPVRDVDRILGIRHLSKIEQTAEAMWAVVPDEQVRQFREAIDAENRAAMMLTEAARRKQKKRWRSLEEGLLELVAAVTNPIEQAA